VGPAERFLAGFLASPALVAQWIEHRFPKPGVAGSIPAGGTTKWPSGRALRDRQAGLLPGDHATLELEEFGIPGLRQ
jgi:hypothetical protein